MSLRFDFLRRVFGHAGRRVPATLVERGPDLTQAPVNPKGFSQSTLQSLGEALDCHTWSNRAEIEASEACMCTACYVRFPPSHIQRWQDGASAICPNPDCGMGGSVIGSASGLDFDDYDYSAVSK